MLDAIIQHLKEIIEGQKRIISLLEEPRREPSPKIPQICQRCKGTGKAKVHTDRPWTEAPQQPCEACRGTGAVLALPDL